MPVSASVRAVKSFWLTWDRRFMGSRKLWQLQVCRLLSALDQRVDVAGPPRVEEDVALADARVLGQQAGGEQRLAHRLGQRPLVAGEAARQMGEIRVIAAPLPHPVQALEDAPRHAADGIWVVVGAGEI